MAKFQLTFYGVEGTVDSNGGSVQNATLTMSTGDPIKEATCYFKVKYTGITSTKIGDETKETEIGGTDPVLFALNAQNIRFKKQMYSPNCIFAEIQIAAVQVKEGNKTTTYKASIGKDTLEKAFAYKKVKLESAIKKSETVTDVDVCDGYYVYQIVPKYKKDAMYVEFKIYSPDHLLTLHEHCRSFVAKKLGSGILAEEIKNYPIPYATTDNEKKIKIDFANMKHLKDKKSDQEHIFPYLVQYNESFYDFLKRTTNRWGEFLYYENGQLHIGYVDGEGSKAYEEIMNTLTYCDLNSITPKMNNAGSYHFENVDEELNTKLTKGSYDKVKGQMDSLLDYKDKNGDIYVMKKAAALLGNDKTLFSFLVDSLVDDTIALFQAKKVSKDKNDKFDDEYFNKQNKKNVTFSNEQFSSDGNNFYMFSESNAVVNASKYSKIWEEEMASGENAVTIDFATSYPDLKLGEIILVDEKKYLIIQVEGYQPQMMKIIDNKYFKSVVDTRNIVFKITAIPQNRIKVSADDNDSKFYPSIISEGHVKRSGMQKASVVDVDDPLRKNRVRVKFDWQSESETPSPWLIYASAAGSPKAGIHGKHYVGEPVIVDFINGNIERPYVVGSIEQDVPPPLKTTSIVNMTPAGQSIKMSDGTGAGATAMLASLNPGTKMLQGFFPTASWFDFDENKYLEGNIELTDKYGFWSIKGSTNDRNISIKSPWGDVKINAFTGITISAPNGDVKIAGKNVTIEAGSCLTLKSGKNIKQKFLMEGEEVNALTIGTTATKIITKKAASLLLSITDLSLLRHILEIAFKPVEGKLQITSGRYMVLEAGEGGGTVSYPIDAYGKRTQAKKAKEAKKASEEVARTFELVVPITFAIINNHRQIYVNAVRRREALKTAVNGCKNKKSEPMCKSVDEIANALWNNPNDVTAAIGFKGVCQQELNPDQNPNREVIENYLSLGSYALEMLNNNQEYAKGRWEYVVDLQNRLKRAVTDSAQKLADAIKLLKDFKIDTIVNGMAGDYDKLKDALTMDNLPEDCIIKTVATKDGYKNFTASYDLIVESERKKINRKFFVALVNLFKFERVTPSAFGGIGKATVPAEPQPDCSDADWTAYVNSIQKMPITPPTKLKKYVKAAFADPFKQATLGGLDKWAEFFHDDWCFGSSKKGQILFSGSEGTMVLDKNIYRANVDLSEDMVIKQTMESGLARLVRDAMMNS